MVIKSWEEGAERAKKLRQSTLEKVPNYIRDEDLPKDLGTYVLDVPKKVLTPRELELTEETDATSLVADLQSGKLTATEVTKAFLRRATLAHKLVNCVTEFLADDALARAAELDEYYKKNGKPIGPLHGLPISVKDHIGIKGKSQSMGYCSLMDEVADRDADIIIMLYKLGAIFHVRTTQPQMLFSIDTSSPLWGATVTPYNRNLTAGGSSGGEGALIAMRGSVLGLGTDIGGSVRVPAAHNGIYAFRVSARRTPYDGICLHGPASEQILCIVGPMAVSLRDCTFFLKTLLAAEPWNIDPYVLRMPWREVPKRRDFTVGVMWTDGVVQPHPPVTRVLKETVKKLEAAGIKTVEWKPYNHKQAWEIISGLYWTDNGKLQYEFMNVSGEPWYPLTKWILPENPQAKDRSIAENGDLLAQREVYKKQYLKLLNQAGVDFILCPTTVGAAMPVQKSKYWHYTAQWNLLDYPAIAFPAGQVDLAKDQVDKDYKPTSELDQYFYDLYKPEDFEKAPVGLQLVGRTYHDEEVASAMEVVDEILHA